jgi:hypothetical protein
MKAKKPQKISSSAEPMGRAFSMTALLICIAVLFAGCGSTSSSPSSQAVFIAAQPLSQTVPIGETAAFTVIATGTAPLSYQWSENGVEIAGATGTSYTTPVVALGEGGSTLIGSFQVTVRNPSSSVASNAATLTAGPRDPKAGDLRFLLFSQVDAPGLLDKGTTGTVFVGEGGSDSARIPNAVGTPLGIGSSYICGGGMCTWPWAYQFLPSPMTGLNMYYLGGEYSTFASDLQSFAASNVVFMSFDLEPDENAYAVAWVQTAQSGGFDYRLDPVVPAGTNQQAQIQAQATLDGTESRVVTAASFDAQGHANLVSYGWTGDTTTVYETQSNIVQHDDVCATATTMAGEGYIISAFGGNDTDDYILIGMRVQGDTLPRPIEGTTPTGPPYFTTVVYLRASGDICGINEQ